MWAIFPISIAIFFVCGFIFCSFFLDIGGTQSLRVVFVSVRIYALMHFISAHCLLWLWAWSGAVSGHLLIAKTIHFASSCADLALGLQVNGTEKKKKRNIEEKQKYSQTPARTFAFYG